MVFRSWQLGELGGRSKRVQGSRYSFFISLFALKNQSILRRLFALPAAVAGPLPGFPSNIHQLATNQRHCFIQVFVLRLGQQTYLNVFVSKRKRVKMIAFNKVRMWNPKSMHHDTGSMLDIRCQGNRIGCLSFRITERLLEI